MGMCTHHIIDRDERTGKFSKVAKFRFELNGRQWCSAEVVRRDIELDALQCWQECSHSSSVCAV